MKKSEINILVALVACLVRTDKTEPDPNNLRVGWDTDRLLGHLGALVINQDGDPAAYAEITREAFRLTYPSVRPDIAALLQLAIFNGERRLPVTAARERRLSQMAQFLTKMVVALPDGTRKTRCQLLLNYHVGVFNDAYGRFAEAAETQKQAAKQADLLGDKPGAAVCCFLEAVYCLKQALVSWVTGEQEIIFSVLEERFGNLVEATRGSDMEISWGQGNGPWHMLHACVWLGINNHPDRDVWATTFLAAAKKLGQGWELPAQFVRAVCSKGDAALAAVAKDTKQRNEERAMALLALMRLALAGGPEAAGYAMAQSAMSKMSKIKIGAQHVCAIAQRLLAEYKVHARQ